MIPEIQMKSNMKRSKNKKTVIFSSITTISILSYATIASLILCGTTLVRLADAVAPTIDYSHNMRILKLPQSTPIGSLIYRLKGSDGDASSQLMFGVNGHEARTLLDVVPVQRSWNEADVYLRSKPDKSHYNFTLFVTDGNKTTQIESTIIITDDELQQYLQQQQLNTTTTLSTSTTSNSLLPFLNTKHVFHVPENAKPNEIIGSLSVLESDKSDLPVRFELRGKGAEHFSINYVFGPKGQSKGELVLGQELLDYEKQNLFSLKVLALNAWTDARFDTRNVASMDIVITVGDVQDSPPIFRNLPQSIRLPTDSKAGQIVYKCEAEDGDFADQRPIQFALDAGSPLANYFDIDKTSGEIKLTKSVAELMISQSNSIWQSSQSMLTIFASELPDPSSYDHLWPPMYARVEIPLLLVDNSNEPPQFLGGWQTYSGNQVNRGQVKTLHGYLPEYISGSSNQLVVRWFTNGTSSSSGDEQSPLLFDQISKALGNRPSIVDLGLGSNGTFELSLEGADAELFHLEPSGFPITRQTTFTLSVAEHANKSLFDHEHNNKLSHLFTVDVVARDFGQPERLSSKIRCLIELVDTNDNWPSFETDLYSFSVYENAPIGYVLGQIRARDSDSMGKVSYVSLSGLDSQLFRLDQETGQVTLDAHLDRERKSLYMFLVEARDSTSDHGLSNYTQMIINVLDVNDNAPVFLQSHYDAVLLSDGTFYQPLQVKAIDADEPGTANSQVAYEIIAGNLNEQFTIDSVSGVIYPIGAGSGGGSSKPQLPQYQPAQPPLSPAELPSTLKEPILPHRSSGSLDQAGKIRPTHEIEDSPRSSRRLQMSPPNASGSGGDGPTATLDRQQQQSPNKEPTLDVEQLPNLDLLMSLESQEPIMGQNRHHQDISTETVGAGAGAGAGAARFGGSNQPIGPITTLVVRAHDFGIPLRSSTVKVNIFNQALLTRSVSLILNGTVDQLDSKREAIERAFSSLTGSRATIESLDALSDSSSLSVARVRLAVPEHSLVDLTDLSALMNAIDYRSQQQQVTARPYFYYPDASSTASNLSATAPGGSGSGSGGGGGGGNTHLGHNIFSDIHSYAIDSNAALERRLLIYIIIVGVCILALLVAWMIYYCCSRSEQNSQKLINNNASQPQPAAATYRPTTAAIAIDSEAANKTHAKMAATSATQTPSNVHHGAGIGSPIANNLAKGRQQQLDDQNSMINLLTPQAAAANQTIAFTAGLKPNNYSMYNGQVWFEPNNNNGSNNLSNFNSLDYRGRPAAAAGLGGTGFVGRSERRASSAPSGGGNSLDSALHSALHHGRANCHDWGPSRNAAGQFFPNTLGYTRNVASIAANQPDAYSRMSSSQTTTNTNTNNTTKRNGPSHHRSSRKVAPMPMRNNAESTIHPKSMIMNKKSHHTGAGYANDAFVNDSNDDDDEQHMNHHHGVDLESGARSSGGRNHRSAAVHQKHHRKQSSLDSTGTSVTGGDNCSTEQDDEPNDDDVLSIQAPASSSVPAAEMSVELDSDQELLGFDSTGTPIIATHTRPRNIKPIVVDRASITPRSLASSSSPVGSSSQLSKSRETLAQQQQVMDQKLPISTIVEKGREEPRAKTNERDGAGTGTMETKQKSIIQKQSNSESHRENNDNGVQSQELDDKQGQPEEGEQKGEINKKAERISGSNKSSNEGDREEQQGLSSQHERKNSLMNELNERISSRKGSAEEKQAGDNSNQNEEHKEVEEEGEGGTSFAANQSASTSATASRPDDFRQPLEATLSSTSASNKRQLLLKQQQQQGGKSTTRSLSRAQAQTIDSNDDDRSNSSDTNSISSRARELVSMKNGELLEKKSIFAMTYSGLATDKLPLAD